MKKLSYNLNNTKPFCSAFLRFGLALLLLGLAYGVYFSSFVQFSAVEVTDYSSVAEKNKPLPPSIPAECNLFIRDWVPDSSGPRYTNNTCSYIEDPQNCIKNGRPDARYMYWRWKPKDCDLPKFHSAKFLDFMRNRSLAFIGDSITRNQLQSLLCILSQVEEPVEVYHDEKYKNKRWLFPSHNFTLSLVWSPFLSKANIFEDDNGVSTGIIQLHLDELDTTWTQQYNNFDYTVIGGGKWFFKHAIYYENDAVIGCNNCLEMNITKLGFEYAYRKAINTSLKFITSSQFKDVYTILRTAAPDHFENGGWNTGGYCNRTVPFQEGEYNMKIEEEVMHKIEMEEFEKALAVGSENIMINNLKLFDVSFLSLFRPDGHAGPYLNFQPFSVKHKSAVVQNDCLHWCLPGPIDSWNDLMMQMLLSS